VGRPPVDLSARWPHRRPPLVQEILTVCDWRWWAANCEQSACGEPNRAPKAACSPGPPLERRHCLAVFSSAHLLISV